MTSTTTSIPVQISDRAMDAYAHRLAISRRFGERIAAGDAVFMVGNGEVQGPPCTVVDSEVRAFSGMNRLMLMQVLRDKGWTDSRFFTLAQIQQSGWTLRDGAKRVNLQYLVATDEQGMIARQASTKLFGVFNASDIEGVGAPVHQPMPTLDDIQRAAEQAGFHAGAGGARLAVDQWLASSHQLDPYRNVPGAGALRTRLAACFLEAQIGLPRDPMGVAASAAHWKRAIDNEPLSLFYAVKDAEVMAAQLALEVGFARQQRVGAAPAHARVSPNTPSQQHEGSPMEQQAEASPELQALFAAREAVLAVPFADKDKVKRLGAMWYPPNKLWFVPQGVDLKRFKEWSTNGQSMAATATQSMVEDAFRKAMDDFGFYPGDVVSDGKWHNIGVHSKPGKNKAGAYLLNWKGGQDGSPTGVMNDKFTGAQLMWTYDGPLLTPEQRAHVLAIAREREANALKETQRAQDVAAGHAREIFALGTPAYTHAYVAKKGISAEGLRMVQGEVLLGYDEFRSETGGSMIRSGESYLLVPMSTKDGELSAVQAIDGEGTVKCFMRGAQKKGTMMVLGADSFASLASRQGLGHVGYAEGIATGASFRAGTTMPLVVCFDAGNLEVVAASTIPLLPQGTTAVLAVDNDQFHVERALGMLSRELGVNPYGGSVGKAEVWDGIRTRQLSMGDAVADGQWHQTGKGKYCLSFEYEEASQVVRTAKIEMVPDGPGRKTTATFSNRGVEAGRTVVDQLATLSVPTPKVVVAVPHFLSLEGKPTDWNDLEQREGEASLRAVLAAQDLAFVGHRPQAAPQRMPQERPKAGLSLAR